MGGEISRTVNKKKVTGMSEKRKISEEKSDSAPSEVPIGRSNKRQRLDTGKKIRDPTQVPRVRIKRITEYFFNEDSIEDVNKHTSTEKDEEVFRRIM